MHDELDSDAFFFHLHTMRQGPATACGEKTRKLYFGKLTEQIQNIAESQRTIVCMCVIVVDRENAGQPDEQKANENNNGEKTEWNGPGSGAMAHIGWRANNENRHQNRNRPVTVGLSVRKRT